MKNVIIVHGTRGHPNENWLPWLKKELEKLNLPVIAPQFPTPENQTLENWMEIMNKFNTDENTVLVGHSLGVPFILS